MAIMVHPVYATRPDTMVAFSLDAPILPRDHNSAKNPTEDFRLLG